MVATIRELVKVNPLFKEHFNFYTQKIDVQDPFKVPHAFVILIVSIDVCVCFSVGMDGVWVDPSVSTPPTTPPTRTYNHKHQSILPLPPQKTTRQLADFAATLSTAEAAELQEVR